VSAVAECDHPVSEVRTWLERAVTLSALWSGALCLTDMATAAAVSAALPAAAAAAHSGAAPLTLCALGNPNAPLRLLAPTPSVVCSSALPFRLSPAICERKR
jgi:hypothetical protein